jgi:hypothetical protein
MAAVWILVWSVARRRWRTYLALALLIGFAGGVVLTAAAGARRTATAYPRLELWSHAAQLDISPLGRDSPVPDGTGTTGYYAALGRQPDVAYMSSAALLTMALPRRNAGPDLNLNVIGSYDVAPQQTADRVRVLAGSLFNPADPRSAMVDSELAARDHLKPGSLLHLLGIRGALSNAPDLAHPVALTFRVSAIVAFDDQVVPSGPVYAEPRVMLTPAFTASAVAASFKSGEYAGVRLRTGVSLAAFERAARSVAGRYPAVGQVTLISLHADQVAVQQAIRPQVIALAAFALLAGLIMLAVIAQLLSRQVALDAVEFPILRVLGMSPRKLALVSMATTAMVTGTGALLACCAAIAASPLMPIGPARVAEPSPGVEVNLAVLACGFAAIAALPLALVARAAGRASLRSIGPLGVAEPAAGRRGGGRPAFGPVTAGLGIRMAFQPGRGRTAVPVRSALTGTVVAIAAVVAAMVFGTSLASLVRSPHGYGQNWVLKLDTQQPAIGLGLVRGVMAGLPGVTGYAAGDYGDVQLAGVPTPAVGVDPVLGTGFVTLLRGRPPARPDEIALGAGTLRAHGWHLGESVPVTAVPEPIGSPRPPRQMRIVGEVVLPAFSEGGFAATNLGQGAEIATGLLSAPAPPFCAGDQTCYAFVLIRYRPGTDLGAAAKRLQAVLTAHGCNPGCATISRDQRPADILDYASVQGTPLALSAMLAVLAVAALAHVLLTSVRRRSRDLAVLKTLGLCRIQLLQVVSWQAGAMAAAALLAGVPAGLLAGRWAWALFASSAGVSQAATIPAVAVLAAIPLTLAAAIAIAARPGWEAARIQPAVILRRD